MEGHPPKRFVPGPWPASAVYAVAGALVGAAAVVVVTALTTVVGGEGPSPAGLAAVFARQPTLWLLVPAPMVLALLGAVVGRREDRIAELNHTLERKVYERTAELMRLNRDLEEQIAQQKKTESVLRSAQEEARRVNRQLERANRRLNEAATQAQQLLIEAESAGKAKSMFLANVTHEIRTPLNGIIGMAELAMLAEDDAESRECLETVATCSRSLLSLIEDILDYSRLDAGRMELDRINFFMEKVVDDAMEIARGLTRDKEIDLRCEVASEATGEFIGDPIRLRQILVNLLGNAVKFTRRGRVTLTVTRADDPPAPTRAVPSPAKLLVSVEDTGIGIPAEKQHEIFETFTQADGSMTREFTGAGLGLAISRSLVELMGGRIWVESEPGAGSTFSFTVVLSSAEAAAEAAMRQEETEAGWSGRPLRILVADDNVVSQIVVSRLLRAHNHSLMFADDGEELIALLEARTFDVVFVGIHLPDMTGFEAAAIVRRKEAERGTHTPIIGLVADDETQEQRWCLKSGMDDVVFKPVESAALNEAIERVLAHAPGGGGPGGGPGAVAPALSASDSPRV